MGPLLGEKSILAILKVLKTQKKNMSHKQYTKVNGIIKNFQNFFPSTAELPKAEYG